jgi:ubiquinone/menaquinone biosynthesis C-methylase UbiE
MQLREFLLGVEGLALLRGLFSGSDEDARARIEEIRTILAERGDEAIAVPTLEVLDGYERWATTYDAPGNPLVSAEQPAVWELLERADPGRALDAACGTGRHTHRLVELGHEVVGVDATRSMLKAARRKVPGAEFVQGDLGHLPFDDDSFDLAVCALALEHLKDLVPPVAELTRVLRTGGALIISESHPALRAIGGAPYFEDSVGASGVVRSYKHGHADYLAAFAAAGLALGRCIEIPFSAEQVAMQRPAVTFSPQATEAAFLGFPAVLIWELTVAAEELPALRVAAGELDGIADRLRAAGVDVVWDESLPGERRFHARDPWGNRIELLSRGPGETPGRAP